jgi:hypothetical protein
MVTPVFFMFSGENRFFTMAFPSADNMGHMLAG